MRMPWILSVLLLAFPLLAAPVDEQRVLVDSPKGEQWLLNGGSFRGEHFSPLDQINVANAAQLGLDWTLDLPAPDGIAATPLVVDGTIYLSAQFLKEAHAVLP